MAIITGKSLAWTTRKKQGLAAKQRKRRKNRRAFAHLVHSRGYFMVFNPAASSVKRQAPRSHFIPAHQIGLRRFQKQTIVTAHRNAGVNTFPQALPYKMIPPFIREIREIRGHSFADGFAALNSS
jgi:hypothetical protein